MHKLFCLCSFLVCGLGAGCVLAETWSARGPQTYVSPQGTWLVRIIPADSWITDPITNVYRPMPEASASYYQLVGKDYKRVRDLELPHTRSPEFTFVSDAGQLITVGNGRSEVSGYLVSIYDENGGLVKALKFEDIYSKDEMERMLLEAWPSAIQNGRPLTSGVFWKVGEPKILWRKGMLLVRLPRSRNLRVNINTGSIIESPLVPARSMVLRPGYR